jgi:predicted nucleic acid-binding protein
VYTRIRSVIEKEGNTIGLFHEATLVTNNVNELSRIKGLTIENWV